MIARFFIDRPIFAAVLSIVITLIGGIALLRAAHRPVPPDHAAGRVRVDQLSRRQRCGGGRYGGRADRAAGQRCRGHALHVLPDGQRRHLHADGHLRHRHRPEHGPGDGAEPCDVGHAATADRGPEPGDHDPQEDPRHLDDRQLFLSGRSLRRYLPEQFRHHLRAGRAAAGVRRLGHQLPGPARLQHPCLARPPEAGVAEHDGHRRGPGDQPAEPGCTRRTDRAAPSPPGAILAIADRHAGPVDRARAVRRHHRQGRSSNGIEYIRSIGRLRERGLRPGKPARLGLVFGSGSGGGAGSAAGGGQMQVDTIGGASTVDATAGSISPPTIGPTIRLGAVGGSGGQRAPRPARRRSRLPTPQPSF